MKMNLHCFANLIPIMILALFSNSGLINATEVGKRTDHWKHQPGTNPNGFPQ